MKKYKFEVTQTDTFRKLFIIESEEQIEAETKLRNRLEQVSLDSEKNTLEDINVTIKPV